MSKFINKYVLILVGLYIFWIWGVPFIVTQTVKAVCENISRTSEYELRLENFRTRTSLLPHLIFYADSAELRSKKSNTQASMKDFNLKLRVLPLLSGKVHINSFSVNEVKHIWSVQEQVEFDKAFFKRLEQARFQVDSVKIEKFNTLIYPIQIDSPIKYFGDSFIYQKKNRFVKLFVNSKLSMGDKTSNIDLDLFIPKNNDIRKTVFDIDISDLDISPLKVYLKHYLPNDLIKLDGIINISADKDQLLTELRGCSFVMKDSAKSVILPDLLNIKSKFNITRQAILLDSVDIFSENLKIFLDGKIAGYFGKTMPTVALNVRVEEAKVKDIIKMLPPFEIEELNSYKLKQNNVNGDILANFSIKGRLPEPDVEGNVYVSDLIFNNPIPNTTQGATIKLKFIGKYVDFDVFVPAGGSQKVWVKGNQELYNIKYAELTVKTTDAIDLKVTQSVLNPLHEVLNFIIGPLPIMDISGNGNLDILVKGNRKNPHIWGILNAKSANVCFKDISSLKLVDSDAVLNFNDQIINFKTTKGKLNNQDFTSVGTADLFGKFDFDMTSQNQPVMLLYKAINSSVLVADINKMIPKIQEITGKADFNIKVHGAVKELKSLKFNENFFVKGDVNLKDNNISVQNIKIDKANGSIKLDSSETNIDLKASIEALPLTVKAKIKEEIGAFVLDIPRLNPNFLITDERLRAKQYLPYIFLAGKYSGNINDIEYDKLIATIKVIQSNPKSPLKIQSGDIVINNSKLDIKNLKGFISEPKNVFQADLRIDNAFAKKMSVDGAFKLKAPDVNILNELIEMDVLPLEWVNWLKDIEFRSGNVDLNCRVSNNNINAFTDLSGLELVYLPLDLPISFVNGNLNIKNNVLKLDKINVLADKMPILIDGEIRDILVKPIFNLYLNSKPQQEFIDKYINQKQLYPVKIKGDIVYWAKLKGSIDNYELKTNVDMSKDSSFYHFGATVGDIENAISLFLDSRILNGKNVRVKEFSYDKVIDSLNGKSTKLNLLKASGNVDLLKDDLNFKDFRIKTSNPTDARIFNIIFRKPNIKQGQFTSDLKFNGKLSNPKVIGDFHIFETDIPFFDTTMKNIELLFKDKTVEITSKGEVMGNDVSFKGVLKNRLTAPYHLENGVLYTKSLDLNRIVNKLKLSEVDNDSTFKSFEGFDLDTITFNNLKFKADNIELRNIHATNYEALASLDNKGQFSVEDFVFNIAQGSLKGKYNYNLKNNDMSLSLDVLSIDANDLTWALFDLQNQIYGDMTGMVNLSCNGTNFQSCMQSLSGEGDFIVKEGRMPKLGSLEYLLRASNLLKGGFTNLSINSVIDLISPLKTGEFSNIVGNFRIKDGMTRNLEIASSGKNLSLYITGTYNFATSIADMEVLGLLSRKISTMFGPVGNLSINTLFNVIPGVDLANDNELLTKINKIPGIELSSKMYRKFIADIKGNINEDNYVTSFKWIN